MNGMSMNKNRSLKVNVHNPNVRLFIGGVDKRKGEEQIMQALNGQLGTRHCLLL